VAILQRHKENISQVLAETKDEALQSLLKEELVELDQTLDAPQQKMVKNYDPEEKPEA